MHKYLLLPKFFTAVIESNNTEVGTNGVSWRITSVDPPIFRYYGKLTEFMELQF